MVLLEEARSKVRTLTIAGEYPHLDHIAGRLDMVAVLELPPGESSVDFLRPVADRVLELRVFDPRARDLRALSTFHSLTSLVLECPRPRYEIDFSRLHNLRQFIAPSRPEYFSALSSRTLRRIVLNGGVKDAHLAEITAPVEELVLLSSPNLSTLEHGRFDVLTSLEIHRAKEFDASSLIQAAPRFSSVEFDTVRSLTGLRGLVEHRYLTKIALLNVAQVDDRDFVNHVDDRVKLWIAGRRVPLDPSDLQKIPEVVLAQWILHPTLEGPSPRSKAAD